MPTESRKGGYRPGAGRKPIHESAMRSRGYTMRDDQDAWLERRASRRGMSKSEYLRQIVDAAMQNEA